jgi:hypothetical protein
MKYTVGVLQRLPGSHVAAIDLGREAKVDSLDVLGQDVCAGAEADGEQLGLQLAHALGERVGDHDCGRVRN